MATPSGPSLPREVRKIGAGGFWNIRGPLKMLGGLIDIGVHMSLIQLASGRFLVLDTIALTPPVKTFLDTLTDNGDKIEAVIATHPFHTLYFPAFYALYPKALYYGTPRHLRNQKDIKWAGSVRDVLTKWEPEVKMSIPAGAEFDSPVENNHFSSVMVLHTATKTIHDDDTIMCIEKPGFTLGIMGYRSNKLYFHPTLKTIGLYDTPEAPLQFMEWVETILKDWDFDNICTAHTGNHIGGAKAMLAETLETYRPNLLKMSESRKAAAAKK